MGNRMCKNKKTDTVDCSQNSKSSERSWKFDSIINRLHLRPTTWKSESHLNQKQVNRNKNEESKKPESIFYTKPLSKSSDWTNADLEVPSKEDEHIHLRNPQLSLIFDQENGTKPTPPPRKHQNKSSNFREKLEKLATRGLQAIKGQKPSEISSEKPDERPYESLVAVEEPMCVSKKINYKCPLCDSDMANHNRDHHHHNHTSNSSKSNKNKLNNMKKANSKRKKNLSVVSLPNYTDLKLSVATTDSVDKKTTSKNDLHSSRQSLSSSPSKLGTYMARCRSLGSIFPQQFKKLRPQKPVRTEEVTSDDSFGPLEDWDLGLIEHYNPRDASLPRPRKTAPKQVSNSEVHSGIEDLIVKDEDIEAKPKPPVRRSESLVKKMNREASNQANISKKAPQAQPEEVCLTPPPSPKFNQQEKTVILTETLITTRPAIQDLKKQKEEMPAARKVQLQPPSLKKPEKNSAGTEVSASEKSEKNDHSSLMRILQEFSIKDSQNNPVQMEDNSNLSSLTPSLVEFEKNLNVMVTEDFINAEKKHTKVLS